MYLKYVKSMSFAIVAMLSGKIGKVTTEQQVLYVSQVDILVVAIKVDSAAPISSWGRSTKYCWGLQSGGK